MFRIYIIEEKIYVRLTSHVNLFFDYVNSKHPNIKFTMELEVNGILSFLDAKISRSNEGFHTSVYRKQSFTGLGISFFSFCQLRFKTNAIKTLLHRAYNVCSTYYSLHNEFLFLKNFF